MAAMPLARRMQWVLHDRLDDGVRRVELTAQLPADLIAVADFSARGAAPLLHPGEPETELAATPLPFELYLTLLTPPLPTGEALPPTGKEWPVVPPVAVPMASPAASSAAPLPIDAALFARLELTSVQAAASTGPAIAPALPSPDADAPAPAPQPSAVLPTAPQSPLTHGGATAVPSSAPDVVEPEFAESARQAAPADNLDSASWLERVAADDARAPRLRSTAAEHEIALPTQARSVPAAPDARLGETTARLREGTPPALEVTKLSQVSTSAVLEATKAGADWLPAGQGSGTSAAVSSATPAPASAASVDLRAPNWQEAFASRVQWLVGSATGEARITLNPPELGAVDVKVSLVDDKTYVQLTTATAAARDELAQSLPRLKELFAASGLELGGASVHDGRGDQRAGHGDRATAPDRRPFGPFVELAAEPTAAVPRRPLGRVDVFA